MQRGRCATQADTKLLGGTCFVASGVSIATLFAGPLYPVTENENAQQAHRTLSYTLIYLLMNISELHPKYFT